MSINVLTFFLTGLCSHLENKGVINNHELGKHLEAMLNNEKLNIPEGSKEELRKSINLFLPIRAVK